ncbi:MAG: HAD family phosphatase [Verrucomicrobiota bacterium]|nr:HAD family phosphatase [Verrucomicrobiota bacterium]
MSLGGVIFDWDGVVVDSSMIHKASWEDLARETKRELPENHFSMGFGKRNQVIIPEILKWTRDFEQIEAWGKRKEELYRQRAKIDGISLLPHIKPLLKNLQQSKIACAIGTSTESANLRLAFTQHPIEKFFNGIITTEDVKRGKPHPEVFLKAANAIGSNPNECVVIEDSLHGIEAAISASMKAVAITSSHPRSTLDKTGAHMIVDCHKELSVSKLNGLF